MRNKLLRYMHEVTAPDRTRVAWFDLVEIALVVLGFLLYFLVRGGVVDRTADALNHARWIIEEQRALGIFIEPAWRRVRSPQQLLGSFFRLPPLTRGRLLNL